MSKILAPSLLLSVFVALSQPAYSFGSDDENDFPKIGFFGLKASPLAAHIKNESKNKAQGSLMQLIYKDLSQRVYDNHGKLGLVEPEIDGEASSYTNMLGLDLDPKDYDCFVPFIHDVVNDRLPDHSLLNEQNVSVLITNIITFLGNEAGLGYKSFSSLEEFREFKTPPLSLGNTPEETESLKQRIRPILAGITLKL